MVVGVSALQSPFLKLTLVQSIQLQVIDSHGVYVETVGLLLKMCVVVCESALPILSTFICLDHIVLTVVIHNRSDIRAHPIDYSPASYLRLHIANTFFGHMNTGDEVTDM